MGNRQSLFNYRQRRRDKHAAAPAKSALTITKSRLSPIRTNKSAKHHREEPEDRPKMKTSSSYPDSNRPVVDDTTIVVDGRTYQNVNSKYYLPNDELEQDRMTNLHFILKHCFDGNYTAPVRELLKQPTSTSPAWMDNLSTQMTDTGSAYTTGSGQQAKSTAHILDIACGTGIWLMEMASEFPHAQFYGIDISVMYPTTIKPPNVHFLRGDVCENLPYPDAFFDYVHMGMVYNCFSSQDRKMLLKEIKRVMKPGAYFECRDVEPHIRNAGPYTTEFVKPFAEVMQQRLDVDVNWYKKICEHMQNLCDFVDIHHQTVSINFMSSNNLSSAFQDAIRSEFEAYGRFYKEFCGLDNEGYSEAVDKIMDECKKKRSYLNYYMCWCRKPVFQVQKSNSDFQLNVHALGRDTPTINTFSTSCQTVHSFSSSKSSSDVTTNTEEREAERQERENQNAINQFIHGYVD